MSDDLDGALRALGQHVAWAEAGDLASSVRDRIERAAAPKAVRPVRRRIAIAAAAVVLVCGSAVGPVRSAVADLVGLGVVQVKQVDRLPSELSAARRLGRPVTLDQALLEVTFAPRLPSDLGDPDAVFVGSPPGGASFVWDEPEVLVTEHPGDVASVVKTIIPSTRTQPVAVDGESGLWLTGPHVVAYLAADGSMVTDEPRLAGNTLVWSRDGVVVRIETDGDLDEALAVAASLDP